MASKQSHQTPPFLSRWRRGGRLAVVLFGLALVFLGVGCKDDPPIEHYRVPKDHKPPQRLLGAIARQGERTWFFKLLGPQADVDKQEKAFKQFIQSVRFSDSADRPVTWTLP